MHRLAFVLTPALALAGLASPVPAGAAPAPAPTSYPAVRVKSKVPALPLGPADLPQTVTRRTLQRGVTHTQIVRGAVDPATPWVVEVSVPAGPESPDPDAPPRSVQDRAAAEAHAGNLDAAGFPATAEPVHQVATADVPAGVLGYRVRLDQRYPTKEAADAAVATLTPRGFTGRSWYTGWDGGSQARGRWSVDVLTINPRRFDGVIGGTFGPTIADRETVTQLAALTHATAAVNAGYFAFSPANGVPGDPAGAGVYRGRLLSEAVADRPVLALDRHARDTAVLRPTSSGRITSGRHHAHLDGIDRVPGLIRNCGGDGTDTPTRAPLHDVTCTDADEVVAFTDEFDGGTPKGPGAEVVLNARGRVTRVLSSRGTFLTRRQTSVQATGRAAPWLARLRVGEPLTVSTDLDLGDWEGAESPGRSVLNGGPELVKRGRIHVTQDRDGFVHADDPSFDYGFVLQRNPRTFAGVDGRGRTVLVTVDGRQLGELGLSLPEAAAVARALGLRDAINLDGGGSTAMAVGGALVTQPSDAAGERPVGDAIYIR
jgi:hypothetical protein